MALRNLERANAENITKVIEETLKNFGSVSEEDLHKKAVGYGADGASVNMGCHSGVGERLKQKRPLITVVHCTAHRLELAFKDVLKNNPHQLQVVNFLNNICCTALGVKGIPTRVGGTRWIPHT